MAPLSLRAQVFACALLTSISAAGMALADNPAATAGTAQPPPKPPLQKPTAAEAVSRAQVAEDKADKATTQVDELNKKVEANEQALAAVKKGLAAETTKSKSLKKAEDELSSHVEKAKEHAKNAELAAAAGKLLDAMADLRKASEEVKSAQAVVDQIKAMKDVVTEATAAQQKLDSANAAVKTAQDKVDAKRDTVCGKGDTWKPCFYAGAFVSSASIATVYADNAHGGETSHALVAAVIPTVGMRLPIDQRQRFSIDIGFLSMLVSKDLGTTATSHKGCRSTNGNFEDKLPCEGDASLIPWVAGYVGLTVSASDVGLLTFMPMIGAASTSLDRNVYPFLGLSVGLISLTKTIQ